jgi:hypothetical protein
MRVGIMVTNHGSHPPEKWAAESAQQIADIIVIEPSSPAYDAMLQAKSKLTSDLEAALVKDFTDVQDEAKATLAKDGDKALNTPIENDLDGAVATVLAVTDASIFASHYRKPEVQAFIKSTLHSHFTSVKQIERSWHADKNPNTPEAKAFRARFHAA